MKQKNSKYRQKNGFSLVELAFLVSVMSMAAIGYFSTISNVNINNTASLKITMDRIAMVEKAIIAFKNQNGRIPCPANPADTILSNMTNLSFPLEGTIGGSKTTYAGTTGGAIPTKTLSLPPEYGLDGWGMKMNYYADTNMCTSPATFIANEGSLSADIAFPTSNLSSINNAAYILVSFGGNFKAASESVSGYSSTTIKSLNADGSSNTAASLNTVAPILGQGYFIYHKTKNQLNTNTVDAGLNILSQQDCIDNSLALASINNNNSSSSSGTGNIKTYITVTERLDANLTTYCTTAPSVGGSYNCGDEAVLSIMKSLQDACAIMYPNVFTGTPTKLCPGGGIYDPTNDYCHCYLVDGVTPGTWSGSGCY
jgi:type II secretory pathway pseudopilin PulG